MKCKNCKGEIEIDGCGGWKHSDGHYYKHRCEPATQPKNDGDFGTKFPATTIRKLPKKINWDG